MRVQLLYFPGCPHVDEARERLQHALATSGTKATVEEIDTTAAMTPEPLRTWGSPTILVDGVDVAGEKAAGGACCRLYAGDSGSRGAPSEEAIRAALRRARGGKRAWLRSLVLLPGAVLPLLPSFACPACIPAYTGLLAAVGLGVVLTERVLAPLIVVFLALGVLSVAWATRSHRKLSPLVVTVTGSLAVVLGRLVWNVAPVLYTGVALLIGASLWNLWLKRPRPEPLVQVRLARKEGEAHAAQGR